MQILCEQQPEALIAGDFENTLVKLAPISRSPAMPWSKSAPGPYDEFSIV
jgi:hypothetical protein